jgi:hypothetical protein
LAMKLLELVGQAALFVMVLMLATAMYFYA